MTVNLDGWWISMRSLLCSPVWLSLLVALEASEAASVLDPIFPELHNLYGFMAIGVCRVDLTGLILHDGRIRILLRLAAFAGIFFEMPNTGFEVANPRPALAAIL